MSIVDPPTEGVQTPPRITRTAEAGGLVLACECRWLRYFPTRPDADAGEREHIKKCKGAPEKPAAAAPKRARATDWKNREAATWIDKL